MKDYPKAPNLKTLAFPGLDPDMLMTDDKEQHHKLRRFMSPSFGIGYLRKLEPYMVSQLQVLFDRWNSSIVATPEGLAVIDVWKDLHNLSLDIIGNASECHKVDKPM